MAVGFVPLLWNEANERVSEPERSAVTHVRASRRKSRAGSRRTWSGPNLAFLIRFGLVLIGPRSMIWTNLEAGMKIQHPLLVNAIGCSGTWVVRRLGNTIDYHFRYEDPSVNPEVARRLGQRYIYAFFHEVMLFPAHYWAWPSMHILISDHRDGELITQVIKRLGFGVVRGSTTRGGARAFARDDLEDRAAEFLRHS